MEKQIKDYEEVKRSIRSRTAGDKKNYDLDELDDAQLEKYGSKADFSDVVQVGSKIIIGGGVGLLAGVVTIAVAASAAEVVIAGVITKVTGVIGGALGLSMGLNKYQKAKKKRADTEIAL
jgi:hypothetical protein